MNTMEKIDDFVSELYVLVLGGGFLLLFAYCVWCNLVES